eukprot:GHVQ01038732.1.p1 GENE.GHVQ01038732.1~~GHVQ01038732.1.p1  ORF type:complete len:305 (-),score=26.09 GHVQ01038732.1:368-1282(-)
MASTTSRHVSLPNYPCPLQAAKAASPQGCNASTGNQIVVPGDAIDTFPGYMKGHGTHEEGGHLIATVCGSVQSVDKLIYVKPLRSRYTPSLGDVVIGRIDEIGMGKWSLDVGSSQKATLSLTSINLPGLEQRRRTVEDELEMRQFFCEGDLVSCEVLSIGKDGGVMLHTRSARYGRVENGCLVRVASPLVGRQAQHMVVLKCRVQVILGNNGFIWVGAPLVSNSKDSLNFVASGVEYQKVEMEVRKNISRVRNCILCLSSYYLDISPKSIEVIYEVSQKWSLVALLRPDVKTFLIRMFLEKDCV